MALVIGGHMRSGTTLLRDLCNLHPEMTVTHEFETFLQLGVSYQQYRRHILGVWRRKGILRYRVFRPPRFLMSRWKWDYALGGHAFTAWYLLQIRKYRHLPIDAQVIDTVLKGIFRKSRIVGDKLPDYVFHLNTFAGLESLSRLVIYRDCRDVVNSTLKMIKHRVWGKKEWAARVNSPAKVASRWVRAIEMMERHKSEIFAIRYEDLVAHPKQQLASLGSWLNVDPEGFPLWMLRDTSVGKHKASLKPEELATVMRIAGPTMERLGYV